MVDIEGVQRVALSVHKGVNYDLRVFLENCLTQKGNLCLVAEELGEITGVAIGGQLGVLGMVDMLAVSPARQGSGIGNALLDELTRRYRKRGIKRLAVLSWKGSAGFYQSLGFEIEKDLNFMTKAI